MNTTATPSRDGYLEHFRARVAQDAIAEALPYYWERRAAAFADVGTETCDAIADACRAHAHLLRREGLPRQVLDELAAVLEEAQ